MPARDDLYLDHDHVHTDHEDGDDDHEDGDDDHENGDDDHENGDDDHAEDGWASDEPEDLDASTEALADAEDVVFFEQVFLEEDVDDADQA